MFVYEKLNKKPISSETLNPSSAKKNLIAVNSAKKTSSSHLILTNTQNRSNPSTTKTEVNSMPHGPIKGDRQQQMMISSQSFDRSIDKLETTAGTRESMEKAGTLEQQSDERVLSPVNTNPNPKAPALTAIKNSESISKSKPRTSGSPSFQKFHSFHKTSLLAEAKCNCFNTQFVCDICTSR